jgi:rod shape determining protein RodA
MSPIDRRLLLHINLPLLGVCLMLFGCGILNLYSASGFRMEDGMSVGAYYQKQFLWGLFGLVGMTCFTLFDYRKLKTMAWPVFAIAVALLIGVKLFGVTIYGAKRWISLGVFNLQPSEVAKIGVLLVGAKLLSRDVDKLNFRGLVTIILIGLVPAGLVITQPDLGSGLNILLLLGGLILYRGMKGYVFKTLLLVGPAVPPLMWRFMKEYQKQRIMTFLNPGNDPLGAGYHIIQSQIAIGSGQMWGKGWLAGTQSQLRFLPEKHTDFAFAVFGEEWGFVGTLVLLGLFCLFLYLIFVSARDAKDRFGSFLVAGVFFYFFWQILINMGMVLGLMPVVGIPLPFISYGGSGTLVNFCLIGLVLNISMRRFVFKQS